MTPLHTTLGITLLACLSIPASVFAKPDVKAKEYATNGVLSEDALIEFLIDYHDIPYTALRPSGTKAPPTPASKRAYGPLSDSLYGFRTALNGKSPPYTPSEVERLLPPTPSAATQYEKLPRWRKIPVITEPLQKNTDYISYTEKPGGRLQTYEGTTGDIIEQKTALKADKTVSPSSFYQVRRSSIGPLRLRRTVDSIMDYRLDKFNWDSWLKTETTIMPPDLLAAPGAKIGYSDNRLERGNGAWSAEGALVLPLHSIDNPLAPSDGSGIEKPGTTTWIGHAGLAVSWKIEEQEKPNTQDIDELKLSIPLGAGYSGTLGEFFIGTEPYYQTDTDFDGGIVGATASFEYSAGEYLGTFGKLTTLGARDLSMRIRAIGLVDYSDVRDTSPYIKRTLDDDWFRLGAQFSIEFGLFPTDTLSKQPPITIGASYRFMQEVGDDNGGYSDFFKANATLWLSPNAGLTLEYQKGETPVADKDIDLITLGLELKL